MRKLKSFIGRKIVRPLFEAFGVGTWSSMALEHIDLQLIEIIGKKREGFFIEAGANDGLTQSNTYYLEKVLGWKGLLVEPLPEKALQCQRNRPSSITVNSALVRNGYQGSFVTLERANLMSTISTDSDKQRVDEHIRKGREVQNLQNEEPIQVPAKPLSQILADHKITHVDFFSLDVEGYEPEVLRGIDFKQCRIDWIFIETRPEIEQSVDDLLVSNGFQWRRSWVSETYSNKLYQLSI